jgi:hypothetical protein
MKSIYRTVELNLVDYLTKSGHFDCINLVAHSDSTDAPETMPVLVVQCANVTRTDDTDAEMYSQTANVIAMLTVDSEQDSEATFDELSFSLGDRMDNLADMQVAFNDASVDGVALVAATGTLTLTDNPVSLETIRFTDGIVDITVLYSYSASPPLATNLIWVDSGARSALSDVEYCTLIADFINYDSPSIPDVTFSDQTLGAPVTATGSGVTVELTAIEAGANGNAIALFETLANGSWDNPTLTGGTDEVIEVPDGRANPGLHLQYIDEFQTDQDTDNTRWQFGAGVSLIVDQVAS